MGFFPETYIEVGSAVNHSPPQIKPSNSYTDGHPGGSPTRVTSRSIGQATSATTKYCKLIFLFSMLQFTCPFFVLMSTGIYFYYLIINSVTTSYGSANQVLIYKLDALRALTQTSYHSTKSYFTSSSPRIEYNESSSRNCVKLVYCSWAIWVNNAAEHLCRVAILNPLQESYLLWRANAVISFERAETNQDKQQGINLHGTNLHKLSSCVFLRITSENVRPLSNTVYYEIFKLHIFYWIRVGVFLKRTSFIGEDAAFCFVI